MSGSWGRKVPCPRTPVGRCRATLSRRRCAPGGEGFLQHSVGQKWGDGGGGNLPPLLWGAPRQPSAPPPPAAALRAGRCLPRRPLPSEPAAPMAAMLEKRRLTLCPRWGHSSPRPPTHGGQGASPPRRPSRVPAAGGGGWEGEDAAIPLKRSLSWRDEGAGAPAGCGVSGGW